MSTILRIGSRGPEVENLQRLLNSHGARPSVDPDGNFGPLTAAAVREFQRSRGLNTDGIVGPQTWAALAGTGPQPGTAPPVGTGIQQQANVDDFLFPLAKRPVPDWTAGLRYYDAKRYRKDASGKLVYTGRNHAGCDLLSPQGTLIYAIADGKLVRGPYQFTGKSASDPKSTQPITYAVEIDHGGILVRYGEIDAGSYVGGKIVKKGTPIAKVGAMKMLHLELYKNAKDKGPLTVRANKPRQRRLDVTDPAPYLDKWVKNLPVPVKK